MPAGEKSPKTNSRVFVFYLRMTLILRFVNAEPPRAFQSRPLEKPPVNMAISKLENLEDYSGRFKKNRERRQKIEY